MHGGEIHREILWGNLKQRGHLEYPGINGKIIFKLFLTFSHPASCISEGHNAPPNNSFLYI